MMRCVWPLLNAMVVAVSAASSASAQSTGAARVAVEVEAGPLWLTRNDARIPPEGGTDFSLLGLTGRGPDVFFRAQASVQIAKRHGLRLLYAPVQITGTGSFAAPVRFVDQTFLPLVSTQGTFKFNTYRVTYRYTLHDGPDWRLQIGAAGLIRDAKIELQQGGVAARYTDLGFVPLGYVSATRTLSDRASLVFDLEGLGSPQGRALDGIAKLDLRLTPKWNLGLGYRMLEGGADVASVYTFAWLHYGVVAVGYRF
jgi:hypothetical protein